MWSGTSGTAVVEQCLGQPDSAGGRLGGTVIPWAGAGGRVAVRRSGSGKKSRQETGHGFQPKWYVVLMSTSVESIDMRLVVLVISEVPRFTRSSVLMLK